MRPVSTGALILAAGFSRRLGRPKQEVVLAGETLLARAVRTAREASLHPIYVVVREPRWTEVLQAPGATVLLNEQAHEGMATSVVAGVTRAYLEELDGLVLMTCDQPALTPDHLRALCANPQTIIGSRYAGKIGVPAYFPAAMFGSLLQLTGDVGARSLLQGAPFVIDESLSLDIDTEDDLLQAEQRLAAKAI